MNAALIRIGFSGALLVLVAGCGGAKSPKVGPLAPVSGVITLDGSPLANASVIYTPKPGTQGTGAVGFTDAKGAYKLVHRNKKDGIEAGDYYVTVTKLAMPDGSPIPEGKSAADVGAVQLVPPPFGDPNSDDVAKVATVGKEGGSQFNFDIFSQ